MATDKRQTNWLARWRNKRSGVILSRHNCSIIKVGEMSF